MKRILNKYNFIFFFLLLANLSFGQQPILVIPEGYTWDDTEVGYQPIKFVFSSDLELIATSKWPYLKIWEVRSGKLLKTISIQPNGCSSICFSADNKEVITSGYDMDSELPSTVKSWNINTGKGKTLLSRPEKVFFKQIQLSYDRSKIICTGDTLVIIYDTKENKIEKEIAVDNAYATYFLKNNKYITFGSFSASIWDLQGNKITTKDNFPLTKTSENPENQFSENSFLSQRNDSLFIHNLNNFAVTKSFRFDSGIRNAEITKNDRYLFINNYLNILTIIDLKNEKTIYTETDVEHFIINNSKNHFLIKQKDKLPVIKQITNSGEVIKIHNFISDNYNKSFSSLTIDQNILIVCYKKNRSNLFVDIIDTKNYTKISSLESHALNIEYATFNKSGEKIFTSSEDSHNQVFDMRTGKLIGRITGLGDEEISELASEYDIINGKQVLINNVIGDSSTNLGVSIVDINQNIICTIYPINNDEYLTLLPNGYYQCSYDAAKLLHYVTKDLKVITFEQLDVKYNRPDKVLEAIGNTNTELIDSYRRAYEKRIKKLEINTASFDDSYSVPEADFENRSAIAYEQKNETLTLHIKGLDNTYKLDRFNVWVNEVPIFGIKGKSIRDDNCNTLNTKVAITLSQGDNRIETSITNVNGIESYRMPLNVNYIPLNPYEEKTYFIGIAIDKFANDNYNLKYTTKDINDLANKLKEKLGDDLVIKTLFNEKVTVSNIKGLKKILQQTNINDKVIISYSGHGVLSKDYDYYLSTYAIDFEKPNEHGLAYDEFENLLDSIPARKKLMLIDACHSGEVDKEELEKIKNTSTLSEGNVTEGAKGAIPLFIHDSKKIGMKNSFELMQELFVNVGRSTGSTIISAAGGTQFALETSKLKNGVFTYSILEYMKSHPEATISSLKEYVNKRVPELTKGMQVPTARTETNAIDWRL